MLYTILFLVRFFPFWAVPLALVFFETGTYYFNRRDRTFYVPCYVLAFIFVVLSVLWLVFEGYWRAGPWIKDILTS